MNRSFLSATALLTGVVWPLFALVLVLSEPIVLLLFGRAWLGIVPIGQLLCLANMVAALGALSGALLLGFKRSGVLLRREVLAQSLVLLCTLAGAQFSISAVALAMIAASCAHLGITFHVLGAEIGLTWLDVLRENGRSLAALGATILGAGLCGWAAESWPLLARIAAGGASGLACWLAAAWALGHPLMNELVRLRARLGRGPQAAA